ncbi:Hypothetical predicted protein, partial [Mytilus galloprovincialis]
LLSETEEDPGDMELPRLQDTYFGRFKPDLGRDTILLTAQLHKKTFQQIQAAVIEGKTYQPQIEENVSRPKVLPWCSS